MIPKLAIPVILLIVISPVYVFAVPGTISVDVDGTMVDIDFDAEGVVINSIEADLNEIELIMEVEVTGASGNLVMTFDRDFFDSQFEGIDDEFFIIADGDFVELEEIVTTAEMRTLSFELPAGTEEVEIFGTILSGVTFGGEVIEEPPVEEPEVIEEPPVEEPEVIEEPPVVEPPVEEPEEMEEPEVISEKPTIECGPGTILKDGICVLEETCGPGTHLEDGECVLDTRPSTGGMQLSPMSEFVITIIATFIIALGIITFLWIISRGSKRKNKINHY